MSREMIAERIVADVTAAGKQTEYMKFFQKKLKEHGVNSPAELADDAKKKFFDEVDAEWKADKEED